ncbi:MAG: hypothetical protein AAFY78_22680 [Cyanobacteria bacterium J06648_16]
MKPSTSLRYSLARLKPLSNPLALIPVTVIALMAVLIMEYRNNPEASQWEGADEIDELTPDQQAEAQFDTLGRLLNEPQVETSSPDETDPADAFAFGAEADPTAESPEAGAPFAAYLDQYSFGNRTGQSALSGVSAGDASQLSSPNTGGLGVTSPTTQSPLSATAETGESALSGAISRLQGDPTDSSRQTQQDSASAQPADGAIRFDGETAQAGDLPNLPTDQSGVVRGTLSGSPNTTFIRTTPSMSPPPGTTGYTPPASLDLSIYNDTLNRTPSLGAPSIGAPGLNRQIPGASTNVLPTPGSTAPPAAPVVPQAAEPDEAFFDDSSAYESFWGF